MAKRTFKFKMTVKISQYHLVQIDEDTVPEGRDIEDYAQEEANATWDCTVSETNENFSQDSELIKEITDANDY
jgi:hypothetical protein